MYELVNYFILFYYSWFSPSWILFDYLLLISALLTQMNWIFYIDISENVFEITWFFDAVLKNHSKTTVELYWHISSISRYRELDWNGILAIFLITVLIQELFPCSTQRISRYYNQECSGKFPSLTLSKFPMRFVAG